jgi:hypothetical protein
VIPNFCQGEFHDSRTRKSYAYKKINVYLLLGDFTNTVIDIEIGRYITTKGLHPFMDNNFIPDPTKRISIVFYVGVPQILLIECF